jgi:hypothetical protein
MLRQPFLLEASLYDCWIFGFQKQLVCEWAENFQAVVVGSMPGGLELYHVPVHCCLGKVESLRMRLNSQL